MNLCLLLLLAQLTADLPPLPPIIDSTPDKPQPQRIHNYVPPSPAPLPTHYGPSGEIVFTTPPPVTNQAVVTYRQIVDAPILAVTGPSGKAVVGPGGEVVNVWTNLTLDANSNAHGVFYVNGYIYPGVKVLYPKPIRSDTNGVHLIFDGISTTNLCQLQTRSATGDWQDFGKPWVPNRRVSVSTLTDVQYRLLVPTTPKRKQE